MLPDSGPPVSPVKPLGECTEPRLASEWYSDTGFGQGHSPLLEGKEAWFTRHYGERRLSA